MNGIGSCTNACVGVIVQRGDRILLIERANPPYGWALPAGHIDIGEVPIQTAARELFEEVGLRADSLTRVLTRMYRNQCRRPGGSYHRWHVFTADCGTQEPLRSLSETNAMRWVTQAELDELTQLAVEHLASGAGPVVWQRWPGLEPVWMAILSDVGLTLEQTGSPVTAGRGN